MVGRVLVRVFVVCCLLILTGAGTYARLLDEAQVSGNTVTATDASGIDLRIKNNDTAFVDDIGAPNPTWTMRDMAPGQYMDFAYSQTREISLRNIGTTPASVLSIGVTNNVIDPPGPPSDTQESTNDMDRMLEIVWMEYENSELYVIVDPARPEASLLSDANGNGWLDLDDLEIAPVGGLHAPAGTGRFQLRVRFRTEASSDYQGDSVVSTFKFTAEQ